MKKNLFVIIYLLSLSHLPRCYGDTLDDSSRSPAFNMHLDSGFLWVDRLSRPLKHQNSESSTITDAEYGPRALGLEHLKLNFIWQTKDDYHIQLGFRPDALLVRKGHHGKSSEVDTRSGTLYKSLNDKKFLDTYLFTTRVGSSLDVQLGVTDKLLPDMNSYRLLLKPGLEVSFPGDLSVIRMNWKGFSFNKEGFNEKLANQFHDFTYQISYFHGDADRAEAITYKASTYDSGPGVLDPYGGGSFYVLWDPVKSYSGHFFLGYEESRSDRSIQKTFFSDASFQYDFNFKSKTLSSTINLRYLGDSWDRSPNHMKPLTQYSFSMTCNLQKMLQYQDLLFGLHAGYSERHSEDNVKISEDYNNLQLDLGFEGFVSKNVKYQFMLAQEHRDYTNHLNQTTDGFRNGHSSKDFIRRFALGLRYEILHGL